MVFGCRCLIKVVLWDGLLSCDYFVVKMIKKSHILSWGEDEARYEKSSVMKWMHFHSFLLALDWIGYFSEFLQWLWSVCVFYFLSARIGLNWLFQLSSFKDFGLLELEFFRKCVCWGKTNHSVDACWEFFGNPIWANQVSLHDNENVLDDSH